MNSETKEQLNAAASGEEVEVAVYQDSDTGVWIIENKNGVPIPQPENKRRKLGVFIGRIVHPDTPIRLTTNGLMPAINDVGFTSKGLMVSVISIKH